MDKIVEKERNLVEMCNDISKANIFVTTEEIKREYQDLREINQWSHYRALGELYKKYFPSNIEEGK